MCEQSALLRFAKMAMGDVRMSTFVLLILRGPSANKTLTTTSRDIQELEDLRGWVRVARPGERVRRLGDCKPLSAFHCPKKFCN